VKRGLRVSLNNRELVVKEGKKADKGDIRRKDERFR
jgi:hypothetical protein